MEVFYDDTRITLGDGAVDVDTMLGVEKVLGSRSAVRDPRLQRLAASMMDTLPPLWKAPTQMAQLAPGTKWCYVCGDVRPKHYFSPDKRNRDGLDDRCKECENERKRKLYAQAVERPVRPYTRREQVAV